MDRKGKAKDKPETKQGASRKRGGGRKQVEKDCEKRWGDRRKEVIKEYLATRCLNQMEIICKF